MVLQRYFSALAYGRKCIVGGEEYVFWANSPMLMDRVDVFLEKEESQYVVCSVKWDRFADFALGNTQEMGGVTKLIDDEAVSFAVNEYQSFSIHEVSKLATQHREMVLEKSKERRNNE